MRPSLFTRPAPAAARHAAPSRPKADNLSFAPLSTRQLPAIMPYLKRAAPWRTCDFTAGGMLMWVDYFRYTHCIFGNTLFVKGVAEDDVTLPAFSMPVGEMGVEQAVALIRDHCLANGIAARLSAVPEEALPALERLHPAEVTELSDWADYLYDARSLATLTGKKYNKKRNHVNRFMADNPGFTLEPLTAANVEAVRSFHRALMAGEEKSAMADYENAQVARVLATLGEWPFEGAVLSVPGRGVVAFTLGEVEGDTLHVHIEKMDHGVAGAGETINHLFASLMTGRYPRLEFINRQDDAGDPGLRRAKESYRPVRLLRKYNVVF